MRIRLKQAGFLTYTGELGHIEFDNGVSVSSNPPEDFVRALATVMSVERITVEANLTSEPSVAEQTEPVDATDRHTKL